MADHWAHHRKMVGNVFPPGPRARTVKPGPRHLRTRPDPGQTRIGPHMGIPSGEACQCTPACTEDVSWADHTNTTKAFQLSSEEANSEYGDENDNVNNLVNNNNILYNTPRRYAHMDLA